MNDMWAEIARDLGDQIVSRVLPAVEKRVAAIEAEQTELCWSEEDVVRLKLLGRMSLQKLQELAKAGEIGFSYGIVPTQWDKNDGRPLNGRRVYMRHHILNYLLAREVKAKTPGQVAMENVYQIGGKLKAA